MTVAVVILNYNGVSLLQKYLPTVVNNTTDAEIVVIDNGSTDQSVNWVRAAYPELQIVQLDKNYGFAEGYNIGLKKVEADLYVLLNSDVETPKGWLTPMIEYIMCHPNCAACQPKILSDSKRDEFEYAGAAGGFIDMFGYPFCRGRVMSHIEKDSGQYDEISEIFWASGACLVIRSTLYNEVGGLDGRFFAHQEEIDLCWRLKARNWSIVCVPQSVVYHKGGGSLGYESPFKTKLNFRNNAILLFKNLDTQTYWYVSLIRFFLDWVASLQMLLQGKPHNAKAVFTAQREFFQQKESFKQDREQNLVQTKNRRPEGIMSGFLLWQVYAKRRVKFNLLKGIKR